MNTYNIINVAKFNWYAIQLDRYIYEVENINNLSLETDHNESVQINNVLHLSLL